MWIRCIVPVDKAGRGRNTWRRTEFSYLVRSSRPNRPRWPERNAADFSAWPLGQQSDFRRACELETKSRGRRQSRPRRRSLSVRRNESAVGPSSKSFRRSWRQLPNRILIEPAVERIHPKLILCQPCHRLKCKNKTRNQLNHRNQCADWIISNEK